MESRAGLSESGQGAESAARACTIRDAASTVGRNRSASAQRAADLLAVMAHEVDALLDFRHGIFPVIFVFDGDIALETLLAQLIQDLADATHARAIGHVMTGAEIRFVFEMAADDPALEHADAIERVEPGGLPVAGVGARSDPPIAILGDL